MEFANSGLPRLAPRRQEQGLRVCFVIFADAVCYLFLIFPKNERANLSAEDKASLKTTINALRRLHSKQ